MPPVIASKAPLANQFHPVIHLNEARGVEPLERISHGKRVNFRRPTRAQCDTEAIWGNRERCPLVARQGHWSMPSTKRGEREHRPANQRLEPCSADLEIPASEWTSFLDSFSLQHEGWLVTIWVTSGAEKSVKVRDARLERIIAAEVNERS